MFETLEEQVVTVAKETERLGMRRHKSDNFNIFGPETGYVVVTPSGVTRDVLGTKHVCVMDFWGKVIERAAEVKSSGEAVMHLYVYKEREDIRVIIHTHARYSTAFSIMNKPIMPIVYECVYLGKTGTVPVAPYRRAGAVDLARKVAEVTKGYGCCLVENYGAIAANKDTDATFLKTQYVEEITEICHITLATGNRAESHALPTEELQKWAYPKKIILQKDRKMKKIIDTPEHYTNDMLHGIHAARPNTVKHVEDDLRCYRTTRKKQGRVAIITNGDTGHLPLFLGCMGENLLDDCDADGVLQSPSSEQIYNMAKEVEAGAGVLFLYGNYTGNIMNFDVAAEVLDMDGTRVVSIVGADDILSNKDAQVRHGVARIFFIYKCTGARIAWMRTLEEVLAAAEKAKGDTRTAGLAPTPCITPEIGHLNFILAEDEVISGMGIHDKPGVWNRPAKTTDGPTEESMREALADMPLNPGEGVCVLINGLGVISQRELYVLSESVHRLLEERGIRVYRTFVGGYTTSMGMARISISICRMADQGMRQWIDMPVRTPFYTQA